MHGPGCPKRSTRSCDREPRQSDKPRKSTNAFPAEPLTPCPPPSIILRASPYQQIHPHCRTPPQQYPPLRLTPSLLTRAIRHHACAHLVRTLPVFSFSPRFPVLLLAQPPVYPPLCNYVIDSPPPPHLSTVPRVNLAARLAPPTTTMSLKASPSVAGPANGLPSANPPPRPPRSRNSPCPRKPTSSNPCPRLSSRPHAPPRAPRPSPLQNPR